MFLLILIVMLSNGNSIKDGLATFADLAPKSSFLKGLHLLYGVVLVLFFLIRYFVLTFKKRGGIVFVKRFGFFVLLPLSILIVSFKAVTYSNSNEDFNFNWDSSIENTTGKSNNLFEIDGKHRGMSVFGWRKDNQESITSIVKSNIEWVAVVPFFYQEDEQTSRIRLRDSYEKWSRQDSVFLRSIKQLHERGIQVQLKPHLWMNSGWRSNISLESAADWDNWFDSYRITILHYAKMAEEAKVGLFCIGTELKTSVEIQPEKWKSLISEIKSVYKGKLTYAANWDTNLMDFPFWDQLDYIGIQAYFPLTNSKNPNLETIKKGWDTHIETLEKLNKVHKKPILFTEIGYRSEASSTIRPWEWNSFFSLLYQKKSNQTQALAYEALFQKLWMKDWFAGMYIWQWQTRSTAEGAEKSLNFSPRFKPAENVMAKWYGARVD